jgi:hypothetical protein
LFSLFFSDFRYDIQRGLRPARSLKVAMQHEVLMYAGTPSPRLNLTSGSPCTLSDVSCSACTGAMKEGLSFDRLVEEAKMRMGRYNVTVSLSLFRRQPRRLDRR